MGIVFFLLRHIERSAVGSKRMWSINLTSRDFLIFVIKVEYEEEIFMGKITKICVVKMDEKHAALITICCSRKCL